MSRAMKDSVIPWIGEIPKTWKVMPYKRIMHKEKELLEKYNGEDVLSLTMRGVIVRDLDGGGKMPSSFDGYQKVYSGEILQCLFDIDVTPRCVGLIKNDGITSPAYSRFVVHSNAYAAYYNHQLRYMDDNKVLLHLSKNIRSSLKEDDFGVVNTCVPPLIEQQRIAEFLDRKCGEIDETIALQEEFIEELKAYKQSVITEAVTRGLNPNVKFKDSGIDWIGKIPQGWEVCRLKNVVKKRNQKADDTTLQYIGLEHLVGFSEEMVETENVYDKEGSNMCFPDDVIFGKLRPYLGKVKVIHEQCCCSAEFLVLQGASVPAYVRYLMLSDWFIEIVNSSTYGAKMPRANADFILNMNVCFPSNIDQQRQISDHLDTKCTEIDSLIAIKQQKIEELKDYKKSVIYEYVTGKKEI